MWTFYKNRPVSTPSAVLAPITYLHLSAKSHILIPRPVKGRGLVALVDERLPEEPLAKEKPSGGSWCPGGSSPVGNANGTKPGPRPDPAVTPGARVPTTPVDAEACAETIPPFPPDPAADGLDPVGTKIGEIWELTPLGLILPPVDPALTV